VSFTSPKSTVAGGVSSLVSEMPESVSLNFQIAVLLSTPLVSLWSVTIPFLVLVMVHVAL
jgi:hypothetical protein